MQRSARNGTYGILLSSRMLARGLTTRSSGRGFEGGTEKDGSDRGIALRGGIWFSVNSVSKQHTSDLTSLALPHIAKLHAYTPGLQPTESGWTKLNTNECPYPPSPRVAEALREEIGADGASLRLYPDPKSTPLRAAV